MQSETPPPLPIVRFGKLGVLLAGLVIAAAVGISIVSRDAEQPEKGAGAASRAQAELSARYLVGIKSLLGSTSNDYHSAALSQIDDAARRPGAKLRAQMLRAYLTGSWPEETVLREIAGDDAEFGRDVDTLVAMQGGHWTPEAAERLRQRHGWTGKLPLAQALPAGDPQALEVRNEAARTAIVFIATFIGGILLVLAGAGLLIWWFIARRLGKFPDTFTAMHRGLGGPMLEGVAIYFASWALLPLALRKWFHHWDAMDPVWQMGVHLTLGALGVLLAFLWPRWRGLPRHLWKAFTGWNLGRGFWREAGIGVISWIAFLPILSVMMVVSGLLMKKFGTEMDHPIYDWMQGGAGWKWFSFLMAAVWAPVSEEMMFRGLFYSGLTSRIRWWAAALLSSFIFAVIHPQGWLAVPVLMTIAFGFAILRRWRGSLVPSMFAHACNNGVLIGLYLLAL